MYMTQQQTIARHSHAQQRLQQQRREGEEEEAAKKREKKRSQIRVWYAAAPAEEEEVVGLGALTALPPSLASSDSVRVIWAIARQTQSEDGRTVQETWTLACLCYLQKRE